MKNSHKVSINRIIGNVIGNLDIKNVNNSIDDFASWAIEAENKIGATDSYKHFECEITINNKKASLPPNFVYLEGLKLGDSFLNVSYREFRMFGNNISSNLANNTAANINTGVTANFRNDGLGFNFGTSDSSGGTANIFSIVNGFIYVNSLSDGKKIGISYQGFDLDDDGWPMINRQHEDAVSHYLMYMYKARRFYEGKLPHIVFKELESRWLWLCGQARGDSEMPDTQEMIYLSNQHNSLLPAKPKQNF